uniref:Uncharacterized protein n=1 Tax=Nelumbo nucifera TaxID=4432 RepID=A0A822Z0B8_NELNU|nr:TPA_asm: hypothetical protein HUJ06_007772 [Nelumbo nucifera]
MRYPALKKEEAFILGVFTIHSLIWFGLKSISYQTRNYSLARFLTWIVPFYWVKPN